MKMKKTFDRILNLILHGINGTPFDFYIYIIFFFCGSAVPDGRLRYF